MDLKRRGSGALDEGAVVDGAAEGRRRGWGLGTEGGVGGGGGWGGG